MNFLDYSKLEGVRISNLIPAMLQSPKHYRYQLIKERQDTDALRLGRLIHTAVLEPMRLPQDYIIAKYDAFRTDEAKRWRASQQASGKTVVKQEEYRAAERMREEVMGREDAAKYLVGGRAEWAIQWIDPDTEIRCKGRVDYLAKTLVDLKSTSKVSADAFGRDAARLYYHAKLAWYQDGVKAVTGKKYPVVIVAVQSDEPHDVGVYRLPDRILEAGREIYKGALMTLKTCLKKNEWPGACPEEIDLKIPAWATQSEDISDEITVGGSPLF